MKIIKKISFFLFLRIRIMMSGLCFGAVNECHGRVSFAKIRWQFVVWFPVISLVSLSTGQTQTQVELRREILSHYNKTVPPGFENSPTDVGFLYFSSRIQQLDESAGTLTVEGILLLNWWDTRLKWNDDPKCKNISYIAAMPNDVWTPKINVFNSGRAEKISNTDIPVVLQDNGQIFWRLTAELHHVCTLKDLRWYPRDKHTCTLSLGALYPQEIGVIFFGNWPKMSYLNYVVRSEERENPHWDLLSLENQESYISAGNVIFYPTKEFIFTIRRQGWPLLATFLSLMMWSTILSWSSFALPLQGKQLTIRLSVATFSLFLSSVFLLVFINTVPGVGQKPPVIIKVNMCVVIMAFLTSLHTVVVSRVHRNSTTHLNVLQKLPGRVQYVLGLNKMRSHLAAGGENGLLTSMETSPDTGDRHFREESCLEEEAGVVETAYDRAHLILQITVLTSTIAFLCLV